MRRKRTLILSVAAVVAAAATAWVAIPASAAAATATFTKTSDWGRGWQGSVTIDNAGTSALTSWRVEFDLPAGGTVGSFWDARMTASGSHRTFTNQPWNGTVPVGSTVTFGFIGSGGAPGNCRLNGAPCGDSAGGGGGTPTVGTPTVGGGGSTPTVASTTPAPVSPASSPAPRSNLLPLTVTNDTGRSDAVYLYVLGTNLSTGKLGYVDAAGTFTAWSGGGSVPVPAPDVSLPGPANGSATTLKLPKGLSGRLYMSFGKKLDFRLTADGLVQPAPWAAGDPNRDILFDWSEFTLNDAGLWLNSSQVDMFAVPHVVSVQDGSGAVSRTGELRAGGRQAVIDAIKGQPDFARSVYTRPDGTVLRVLAPGKAADAGLMSRTYLDPYISAAWGAYTGRTLTVVPFGDQPSVRFSGRTSGNVLNFTDTSGRTVASFPKPSTADVWGCDGALAAPNDQVVGPIARTLCAALQRGTLGTLDTQPSGTAGDFYRSNPANQYAKIIHASMRDGKAYAFAFDDVQNQESLVHADDPRSAGITLTAF
jgi:hypothetical protein